MESWDWIIAGAGFGGALLAAVAARLGKRVLLIERTRHPRCAIGESTTTLGNLLLDDIARRHGLDSVAALAKWGTWQERHPGVAGGLKRGFTFRHHPAGDDGRRPGAPDLMVAASPNDRVADTHWFRADVDQFITGEAVRAGVTYWDQTEIVGAEFGAHGAALAVVRDGVSTALWADLFVDATGPRGLIHRLLGLKNLGLPDFPDTCASFTHFENVGLLPGQDAARLPFAPDAAALHHLFEGGWIWVLRFNNGLTSAGVSARRDVAQRWGLADGEAGWRRLIASMPEVESQFRRASAVRPWVWQESLPYRASACAGPGWVLLPSAAGFADPLFSTGFALTLLGIERLAAALASPSGLSGAALTDYATDTESDLLAAATLTSALYRNLHDPGRFRALALVYFAAVSYAETARRLGRPHLAPGFLMRGRPDFWPGAAAVFAKAADTGADEAALMDAARLACEDVDVGGWFDRPDETLRGVEFEPLRAAAGKLGTSPAEIDAMLRRCGALTD